MPSASDAPGSRWRLPLARGLRVVAAIGGGYLVVALGVTVSGALLARWGMARSEAVALASMLGFVAYLVWLLWAFSVRRAARLATVLALSMAAMLALQWWLERA